MGTDLIEPIVKNGRAKNSSPPLQLTEENFKNREADSEGTKNVDWGLKGTEPQGPLEVEWQ
jgi:hypothetical protein